MREHTLVAGIGNVFLSDDGFGVAVAERLASAEVPDGVRIADYGIRGVHLAYTLLDGYRNLLLVDAVPMGEPPGTLAVIEPGPAAFGGAQPAGDTDTTDAADSTANGDEPPPYVDPPVMDSHTMDPATVLRLFASLGGSLDHVYVIGCEPESLDPGMELSIPVASAVALAAELVTHLLTDALHLDSPARDQATDSAGNADSTGPASSNGNTPDA